MSRKKNFEAMRLMEQPISPLPLIDTNRFLSKELIRSLLKSPS